ncbi:methyltransferase [candidate division CSSED10-310 bacterium]|uniref:Methyltransferase n=1 Tax=candidate division CSSED10-310 bacterium TaxID=2855610 RepID=A0ABV6YVF5_UNCC1
MKPKTTEDVLLLLDSYLISAALGAALELGLFWLLEQKPLSAAIVAQKLRIPGHRCQYWLQLLERSGLIESGAEGYVPSSVARTAILNSYSQESWALLAEEERSSFPTIFDFTASLRDPTSVWERLNFSPTNYVQLMKKDPDRARRFTRMLYEIHLPLAPEIVSQLDMEGIRNMMDLGGGSGVISMALLKQYPDLKAVVVDIENVCLAGQTIARENGLQDRLQYHVADFLLDKIPSGFDMVLECDVNIYTLDLFRKIGTALNPGGRLVIIDQLTSTRGLAHPSRITWALQGAMSNPDYAPPTSSEVKNKLTASGFTIVNQGALPRRAGQRWASHLEIIEAVTKS